MYISTQETTKMLRVSVATVCRLIRQGKLKARKKTPGKNSAYLIDKSSVEALISELENT